jgi:hypothetical protein
VYGEPEIALRALGSVRVNNWRSPKTLPALDTRAQILLAVVEQSAGPLATLAR